MLSYLSPNTVPFQQAAIAFAEAAGVTLDIFFTAPADPIFIETDGGDSYDSLFVISTCDVAPLTISQRPSQQQPKQQRISPPHGKKRGLEDDEESISRNSSTPRSVTPTNVNANDRGPGSVIRKKPMKAAQT